MNNHFDHISATEKLKAETLKNAKRKNWAMFSSVAAILVVFVGVSIFFLSPEQKKEENDMSLYNNAMEGSILPTPAPESFVNKGEENDLEDYFASDIIFDNSFHYDGALEPTTPIVLETEKPSPTGINEEPSNTLPPAPEEPETTPSVFETEPVPTTLPPAPEEPETTPIVCATPSPIPPSDGLSVQVTERPADYDDFIAANRFTMYVIADDVNAYDRASTDAPVKFTIPKGSQVIADRNFQRKWAYVHYEENGVMKYGFVLEENLSEVQP